MNEFSEEENQNQLKNLTDEDLLAEVKRRNLVELLTSEEKELPSMHREKGHPFLSKDDEEILQIFHKHGIVQTLESTYRHNGLIAELTSLRFKNRLLQKSKEDLTRRLDEKYHREELEPPTLSLKRLTATLCKIYSEVGRPQPTEKQVRHAYSEWVGQKKGDKEEGRPRAGEGISLSQDKACRFMLWYMNKREVDALNEEAKKTLGINRN